MKIIIYLFPILVNYILGGTFFITAYRFAAEGAGGFVVGLSMAGWAVLYCAVSLFMGKITTERNAPGLIVAGCLLLACSSAGFLWFDGLYTQFVWIGGTGIGCALYCTPFQVFMKSLEPDANSGVVRATALYTFAWSVGLATGPFIFGLFSARTGFLLNLALSLMVAVTVLLAKRFGARPDTAEKKELPPEENLAGRPDFAWVGWMIGGIGVVTVCQIRTMWPFRGAELEISKVQIGLILALVSYVQGFTALALIRSRTWMYRADRAVIVGLLGITGLGCFAFGRTLPVFYTGAVIYALYSGCFYFYLVYHALANKEKAAFHVAINEVTVGITSIVGPLLGGWAAGVYGSPAPFWGSAVLTAAATVIQAAVFARAVRRNPQSSPIPR